MPSLDLFFSSSFFLLFGLSNSIVTSRSFSHILRFFPLPLFLFLFPSCSYTYLCFALLYIVIDIYTTIQ
ncbi:hypothetical protein F4703DRAFT_1830409 [Phycomyces blakesleeanus]